MKLSHTCHFNNLARWSNVFREIIFQKYIKRAAQIKVTWRDGGRWGDHRLDGPYNNVNDILTPT